MLLVPALMGVIGLLRERAPLAGYVGGSLAVLGMLVAIGDSLEQPRDLADGCSRRRPRADGGAADAPR
jgi:hypothetical protein